MRKTAVVLLLTGLLTSALAAADFFVAVNGNDSNPGTADKPFATLERARAAVRAMKDKGALAPEGLSVEVGGGDYQMRAPLKFTAADSGAEEAPIVYYARADEKVSLVGGKIVAGWSRVTNTAVLARMDESAVENVWRTDLKALGVAYPESMKSDPNWISSEPGLELFFNGQPMTLARWPNESTVLIGELQVKDGYAIRGTKGSRVGKFAYEGDRPKRWVGEKDIMLHGYWFWDWADQRYRVESIDTQKRIITLPSKPAHSYGFRKGQWYYAFNLLSELDKPGEWYLDRDTGILYFWAPGGDPSKGVAMVSVLSELIVMEKASHITLRGFTLEACQNTALSVKGGSGNQVLGCAIRNTGGSAASISGVKHRIAGCDLYQIGRGGIAISGGSRETLTPAGLVAENNHIHHFGRWKPVYSAGISLRGVGNRVAHNLIHDSPHMAISFGGNEHMIEYNELHHVVQQSNDAGAIYCGRDWAARGNVIRHNYLHHISGYKNRGCVGVYLDDQFSAVRIYGNLFYQVTRAAFIGGGNDSVIENNIFVDCKPAIHIDARGLGWQSTFHTVLAKQVKALPYLEEPWISRYPQLQSLLDDPDRSAPKGNVVARNIQWRGKWNGIQKKAYPYVVFKYNLFDLDPHFVDEKALDFRLKEDSPAFKVGFKKIPYDKIGLYQDEIREALPGVRGDR